MIYDVSFPFRNEMCLICILSGLGELKHSHGKIGNISRNILSHLVSSLAEYCVVQVKLQSLASLSPI